MGHNPVARKPPAKFRYEKTCAGVFRGLPSSGLALAGFLHERAKRVVFLFRHSVEEMFIDVLSVPRKGRVNMRARRDHPPDTDSEIQVTWLASADYEMQAASFRESGEILIKFTSIEES
jgi:hypothetical protein